MEFAPGGRRDVPVVTFGVACGVTNTSWFQRVDEFRDEGKVLLKDCCGDDGLEEARVLGAIWQLVAEGEASPFVIGPEYRSRVLEGLKVLNSTAVTELECSLKAAK